MSEPVLPEYAPPGKALAEMTLAVAEGPEDMAHIRALFLEYAESLGFSLCFQGFDEELADLPGRYGPPYGRLLLARVGGAVAGGVGLRPIGDGVCEMKRLYVRPEWRRHGVGRRLAAAIVEAGRDLGYFAMRLDTLRRMAPAMALYRMLGFVEVPAYYDNPLGDVVYFEKRYAPRPVSAEPVTAEPVTAGPAACTRCSSRTSPPDGGSSPPA